MLKPYFETKDSGLDWIGEIPAQWDVSRNGRLFSHRVETDRPELPVLEVSLKTGVTVREPGSGRKQAMSDRSKYKVAEAGDIAYNMMRMWQGAVGVAPVSGLVSPAYVIAQPRPGTHTGYYSYLFRTAAYKEEVNRRSRGIVSDRNRLYWQDFKQMPALQPPADEQERIAEYLDDHGRQSDKLIRSKRRLIALLNEQKQAVIQRAVTRGIDPDAPTKPSGVDWLGDVPEHWETRRTKHVAALSPRKGSSAAALADESVQFLPMETVGEWGSLDLSRKTTAESGAGLTYIEEGDVIVAKITPCFENGKGALCAGLENGVGFGSTEFHVLRPSRSIEGRFLYYVTRSPGYRALGERLMYGAGGQKRVPSSFVSDTEVPLPDLAEQHAICDHIDSALRELDLAASKVRQEVKLIQEYRQRLVADIVTGKLAVAAADAEAINAKPRTPQPAPDRPANVPFQRATVAAEITSRLRGTKGFGRVVLQKALVVTSGHLRVDLGIEPKRKKLGPFDNRTMHSVHSQFERSKWFKPVKLPGGWRYDPLDKCGAHEKYVGGYLGGQTEEFDRLMGLFAKMDMDQAEIVGTLYTAWNDEIIGGNADPTDDEIVDQVWDHWHEHKRRFGRDRWLRALAWMRDPEKGHLVPNGFGVSSKPAKA